MKFEEFTVDTISVKLREFFEVTAEGRLYFGFEWGDFLRYIGMKPESEGVVIDGKWQFTDWARAYHWIHGNSSDEIRALYRKNMDQVKRALRPDYDFREFGSSSMTAGTVMFFSVERRIDDKSISTWRIKIS